jgi:predicted MPP superfamily phosphohydrolase
MRGGLSYFLLFVILFILAIDIYSFRGVRILTSSLDSWLRLTIHIVYWLIPVVIFLLMIFTSLQLKLVMTSQKFRIWYFMMGMFVLFYVPKIVFMTFQLGNDLIQGLGFLLTKMSTSGSRVANTASVMSRAEFLTRAGILVAAIPFLSVLQGITSGRYNYKIKNLRLVFQNLPTAFNGLRIVQISDWHIGSFLGQGDKVRKAVDMINAQEPELILFTGDLVNNIAEEVSEFIPELKRLKARYGIFSILGNHDYGEYVSWESTEKHQENMERLFQYEQRCGFRLLRNESVVLERDGEKIGLAGVENWGLPPFPQYADLQQSMNNIKNLPFKILMSHDPSHWDAEVLGNSDIDLTLSGHTHGMQFGINIPGLKWSPVKWRYPRWAGLYSEGNKKLYVNVGIGYIGFPGRVGFLPEITVFELSNS